MLINIRQRVYKTVDGQGYFSDSVTSIEGDLGSGMFDKYGREICSGDKVQVKEDTWDYTVKFVNGAFYVGDVLLSECLEDIEIVGHI